MSEGMSSSWRYISSASSRASSLSWDYINITRAKVSSKAGNASTDGPEGLKGWRAWAGQKLRLRKGQEDQGIKLSNETLNLFPGWAVRRYRKPSSADIDSAFEVEVFVSGFAISHRSLENASRSQRAFIRLAKGFAALPKITADAIEPESVIRLSPSTEALLQQKKLPPRPDEITEDYVLDTLERQLERVKTESSESCNSAGRISSVTSSNSDSSESDSAKDNVPVITALNHGSGTSLPAGTLRKLHENLEKRLQPFWSTVLASRTVRIHLFGSPHHYTSPTEAEDEKEASDKEFSSYGPVDAQDVITAADGSFQVRFVIKWEDLCQHPGALHIAFGDKLEEHDLLVAAQIQPAILTPGSSNFNSPSRNGTIVATTTTIQNAQDPPFSPIKTLRIPISHSPIRVISDIDDTVKLSNILCGARTVFQNVFVRDLKENIIPGMGEWYTSMWSQGVRFHYVSNGPFELLPIVNEFFQISQLPPGSIRLKSYAGRSIFHGLLTAPATRKRAGVIDILDSFPESRFILIGDTGEQDMELYAELARERPRQILAVFLRDVEVGDPIDDPTGWKSLGVTGSKEDTIRPRTRRTLSNFLSNSTASPPPRNETSGNYFTSTTLTAEPQPMKLPTGPSTSTFSGPPPSAFNHHNQYIPNLNHWHAPDGSVSSKSSTLSSASSGSKMTETEKRKAALQARVHLARTLMPSHIPLRVFRNPSECVEVDEVLGREQPALSATSL
ncbi:hypothetical protein H2248_010339 [Termitomyces sp. 'cryptogamus']|nr:hypothetical protein H2248_010339 [Termitomyces sp. 'cryptogamus']